MRLTGIQVQRLSYISDGAEVEVNATGTEGAIVVQRLEDGLTVEIDVEGSEELLQESKY